MATFPERALAWLNALLGGAFDAAFGLLGVLPALASLFAVSLATGAGMLLVIARTSNQPRMAATRRAMQAGLFEIRLFGDDLPSMLRSLGDVLRENVRYLGLALVPLCWMALPLTLLIAQLQAFYGYEGLVPGQATLVKVDLSEAPETDLRPTPPILEAPVSIRVETPGVQLVGSKEVLWRIVPTSAGAFEMTVRRGSWAATKTVRVGTGPARRSPLRATPGLVDLLLYPSEPPLAADSPVDRITVTYPDAGIDVLGWRAHWLVLFVAFSMAAALILARRYHITV